MQWRHLAEKRPQHATEQLTKDQVGRIWHQYIEDFIDNEANDTQRNDNRLRLKSRAEAKLKKDCGTVMVAKLIWKVGLPDISEARFAGFATEHRDSIATDTKTILKWLSMLANEITEHKATPTYQEHACKSGTDKNKSGLTDMELSMKEEKKRAARMKYGSQPSTASGSDRWQAPAR